MDTVAGVRVHWHQDEPATPILYLHGVPTGGWDWLPFLARTGGVAPDLPGFAQSEKPAGFDYTLDGYADFLEAFVARAGLERHALVVHDWGAVGLVYAQRHPERIERLVLMNNLPLFADYRWHWIARIWRTPLLGELFNRTSTRWGYKQISRQANATPARCRTRSSTAPGSTSTPTPTAPSSPSTARPRRRRSARRERGSASSAAPPSCSGAPRTRTCRPAPSRPATPKPSAARRSSSSSKGPATGRGSTGPRSSTGSRRSSARRNVNCAGWGSEGAVEAVNCGRLGSLSDPKRT